MRTVVVDSNLEKLSESKTDDYADKIIKYLPGEAVALYVTGIGLITAAKDQIPFDIMTWVIFIGLLVTLPIYLRYTQKVKYWMQIAISTLAYVLWVLTLGGPFAQFSWYHPVYGSLGVLFFTFLVPKFR